MKHVSKPDLIRLASGELDGDERSEAVTHLANCKACRAPFEELSAEGSLLDEWTVEVGSRDVWSAIEQRLDQPGTIVRTSRSPRMLNASRIAAAILLAIGIGHTAGRLTWTANVAEPVRLATAEPASGERAAEELGLYVFDSPTPAGLYAMVHDLTDATPGAEVTP